MFNEALLSYRLNAEYFMEIRELGRQRAETNVYYSTVSISDTFRDNSPAAPQ